MESHSAGMIPHAGFSAHRQGTRSSTASGKSPRATSRSKRPPFPAFCVCKKQVAVSINRKSAYGARSFTPLAAAHRSSRRRVSARFQRNLPSIVSGLSARSWVCISCIQFARHSSSASSGFKSGAGSFATQGKICCGSVFPFKTCTAHTSHSATWLWIC